MYKKDDELYIYYLIATNLKRIRKAKGLTVAELADRCHCCKGFIFNIESTKYLQTFSIGSVYTFAKALGVDIRDLLKPLDEEDENENTTHS